MEQRQTISTWECRTQRADLLRRLISQRRRNIEMIRRHIRLYDGCLGTAKHERLTNHLCEVEQGLRAMMKDYLKIVRTLQ